jgi:hypothetical protein
MVSPQVGADSQVIVAWQRCERTPHLKKFPAGVVLNVADL